MSGMLENRERGIPGGQVVLDVKFYQFPDGPLVDDDRFNTDGTLPIVEIYDPNGTLITTSATPGQPTPIRIDTGKYEYTRAIGLTDEISSQWKIVWKIRVDDNDLLFNELFSVVEAGDANFGVDEYRVGFAFNNPDLTSDHYYPNFGLILHPDELRYMTGFGNKLVSPDANQTYDDNMLQYYIDNSLAMIERDLGIDLIPRLVKHKDSRNSSTGAVVARTDIPAADLTIINSLTVEQKARTYIRESGYPYRSNNANHYAYIKLRRRPLREVRKAILQDPLGEGSLINLLPWVRDQLGFESRLQFYPDVQTMAGFPYIPTRLFKVNYPFNHFPDAYLIDYDTGYLNAAEVPVEFRSVLIWTAGIWLMEDFSDGKSPGISSASANLVPISESYSTTQSATNSLLGARIAYYRKHLAEWLKMNKFKYTSSFMGVL